MSWVVCQAVLSVTHPCQMPAGIGLNALTPPLPPATLYGQTPVDKVKFSLNCGTRMKVSWSVTPKFIKSCWKVNINVGLRTFSLQFIHWLLKHVSLDWSDGANLQQTSPVLDKSSQKFLPSCFRSCVNAAHTGASSQGECNHSQTPALGFNCLLWNSFQINWVES